ncbi:MAG: BNR repeat-containing glycosyl hydrolase, partial [uncultured bacterium]
NTAVDGTIAAGDIGETDGAEPIVTAVDRNTAVGYNRLTFTYSENMTVAIGTSTATKGDTTAAGTVAGFGSFATPGDVTVPTTKNTVGGTGTATITVLIANQNAGYMNTASTTEPSGNFTPVASAEVADAALNQVNIANTPLSTTTSAWDLTKPTITSVTVSDFVNNNGKIDRAVMVLSEAMRDSSLTNANATLGTSGTTTGTFTTDTANDATTTFNRTTDDNTVDTSTAAGSFLYSGATTLVTDIAGNLLNTTTDGQIVAADIVETDGAQPIVTAISPASGATAVSVTANIVMTFSEAMQLDFDEADEYAVAPDPGVFGAPVWSNGNKTVTLSHAGNFLYQQLTTVTTTAANIEDVASNNLNDAAAEDGDWSFTTAANTGGGGGGGGTTYYSAPTTSCVLTSPNGNEILTGGQTSQITWTTQGTFYDVNLYYSVDGGNAWGLIASGQANDGTYSWTVPNTSTSNGKVRVDCRDSGGAELATDRSDSAFTINLTGALPIESAPQAVPEGFMSRQDANNELPTGVLVDYLVKLPNDGDETTFTDTTVYYVGLDAKRHPFPSAGVYFSWYADFSGVKTMDMATLSQIGIGTPVLVRPGSNWVKIQSDPKTYYVEPGSYVLRHIADEATARMLGGSDWSSKVIDIEPTYFMQFGVGSTITSEVLATDWPKASLMKAADSPVIFYTTESGKRPIGNMETFEANHFQTKYIEENNFAGWLGLQVESAVNGFEDALFSLQF